MKTKIIFILSVFYLFSCSEVKHEKVLFQIDTISEQKCKLSELLTSVEYIPLETNELCLLDALSKIIYRGDNIYVKSKNEVIKFDKTGKYIGKLSRMGDGPNDYSSARDVEVIQREGNWEIWIAHPKGISRYDADSFEYLGLIKTKYPVLQFKYLSDNTIILVTPGEYSFHLCDITGKLRNEFLPNDPANLSHSIVQFITIDQKIVYPLDGTVDGVAYNSDSDELEVVQHTGSILKLLTREDNREYMERYGYLNQPQNINKVFQRVVTFRQWGGKTLLFIRSPKDEKMLVRDDNAGDNTWRSYTIYPNSESDIENDLLTNEGVRFLLSFASCDCDNAFMGQIPASDLAGSEINGKVIDEEDNPVLIRYSIK